MPARMQWRSRCYKWEGKDRERRTEVGAESTLRYHRKRNAFLEQVFFAPTRDLPEKMNHQKRPQGFQDLWVSASLDTQASRMIDPIWGNPHSWK